LFGLCALGRSQRAEKFSWGFFIKKPHSLVSCGVQLNYFLEMQSIY
jgi:hypothetical protein